MSSRSKRSMTWLIYSASLAGRQNARTTTLLPQVLRGIVVADSGYHHLGWKMCRNLHGP
jgi:hypothetical protein